MSLADELLADLDDAETAEEHMSDSVNGELEDVSMTLTSNDSSMLHMDGINSSVSNKIKSVSTFSDAPITCFAKLRSSEKLARVMSELDRFSKQLKREKIHGPVESDPEYQCIVEANNLMVEIDNEINIIHKYVRDLYSRRFPELESLVPGCLDYLKMVLVLGNEILERSKQTDLLASFLTPATIMVVSVTASTTQGSPLDADQLQRITDACTMAIELQEMRVTTLTYVESRMSFFAPNTSILVGASTAAKLMGHAGGLTALTKMPSCNILVLGAQKRLLSGFSNSSTLPHTGYIYNAEVVQKLPPDLRQKAARLLANKVALAARVDLFHESTDGHIGEKLMLEVERKFDKWLEPPPVKTVKALPAPIEPPAKKRGGRRYRKMKERLGMSELRRSANRIQFGEISDDAYQSDLGFSLGSLGQRGIAGRLRAPQADSKTKARVSKALQHKLSRFGGMSTMPTTALGVTTWGGNSTVRRQVAGTSSSIAFTPLQGLEIVNPQAAEKMVETSNKYFSSTSGFAKIQSKTPKPGLAS
ncbi:U4/U6 small nuclear ribonucleoprotein PRP31 [Paragonimus westermani]|uniref:U4/U6 small nuclear ribonucleoprotein Prp31 n=1 Tax=Paragonimus westermani TaxID=34504 RepID=A0A5J4NSV2_9TREM|nr:U4/U6 small nuclear ribonucleoprotein PRP31 [Paragonimus westermani]